MLFSLSACILATAALLQCSVAQREIDKSDDDLWKFVSRPDLRPPKFHVGYLDEDRVAPGYWFVAPYVDLTNRKPTRIYQTNQVGPTIYDNRGELVWSGAGLFPARNVFDFKRSKHGSPTFLLGGQEYEKEYIGGAGIIMNSTFEVRKAVRVPKGAHTINMHEFNVLDDGKTALMFMHEIRLYESDSPEFTGWIVDLGFVELDIETNKPIFEWWASDHVHPLESTVGVPNLPGASNRPWDYFHINSVDKDKNGDYLVSARHANTIYKISGKDGHIIWRLGGRKSSFKQQGFNFSSQHDARFRTQSKKSTIISFLNNASDGRTHTADVSSAMVVSLDTTTMVATLVQKFDRPDGRRTNLRGNVQLLPNANTFVSWSANSYISEFADDEKLVLSAYFASDRFATYRSYKYTFTGHPVEPPDLVCNAYGVSAASATTACFASWNGATEVRSWRFFEVNEAKADEKGPGKDHLGTVARSGFETSFMFNGYAATVFVEALDAHGKIIGRSSFAMTTTPENYDFDTISNPELKAPPNPNPSGSTYAKERKIFGGHLAGIPALWQMVFCVMMGAAGTLLIVYSSKLFRSSHTRSEKGYIRV